MYVYICVYNNFLLSTPYIISIRGLKHHSIPPTLDHPVCGVDDMDIRVVGPHIKSTG